MDAKINYSYELLRRYFRDCIALQVWNLIQTAEISNDEASILVSALQKASDEDQQLQIIHAVWDRYYRRLAEKILP